MGAQGTKIDLSRDHNPVPPWDHMGVVIAVNQCRITYCQNELQGLIAMNGLQAIFALTCTVE